MGAEPRAGRAEGSAPLDAVVVGAGFSGLYQLHRLRELGFRVRLLEAGEGVGGTWYWNAYPGARCDSESYYYQYSFSPELLREWRWSERFPAQPEVRRYLDHVADRFDLRRDIRLGARVRSAVYDEAARRWEIETARGDRVRARFCIMATGFASAPQLPPFQGLEDFTGEWHHTARWPHEGVAVAGRRVGVIGTGATGVQVIQATAPHAAQLTVFQRTPNYALPMQNRPMDEARRERLLAEYPEIRRRTRETFGGFPFDFDERSALEVPPEEREAVYERLWSEGSLRFWVRNFGDLLVDERANATASDFIRRKVHERVADPAVAESLCPATPPHPFGTKRPSLEQGYYEIFDRENVTLVDLRRTPIERITPRGVRTRDREHPLDLLVLATGFDAVTGGLTKIDVRGRGGASLAERWAHGPRSYLGMQAAGFPNLFWLYGPQSPSGFCNGPTCIEQQVEWVGDCLDAMRRRGRTRIEPTERAEEAWVAHVNEAVDATLFPRADSWYMGANVPGKARAILCYPKGAKAYRERCEEVAAAGYEGFELA